MTVEKFEVNSLENIFIELEKDTEYFHSFKSFQKEFTKDFEFLQKILFYLITSTAINIEEENDEVSELQKRLSFLEIDLHKIKKRVKRMEI